MAEVFNLIEWNLVNGGSLSWKKLITFDIKISDGGPLLFPLEKGHYGITKVQCLTKNFDVFKGKWLTGRVGKFKRKWSFSHIMKKNDFFSIKLEIIVGKDVPVYNSFYCPFQNHYFKRFMHSNNVK